MEKAILMNPDASDLDFPIIREKVIQKGEQYALHWHDFFEYEIILDGQAKHVHNQNRELLGAGCAYLMSYYDFHSFYALEDTRLLSIQFRDYAIDPELAQYLSFGVRRLAACYESQKLQKIREQIERMQKEQKEAMPFYRHMMEKILSELVIDLLRQSEPNQEQTMPPLVQRAVSYLILHFREELSLSLVAEKLHVSANYLGALFRDYAGGTFREYLNTLRLKYACRLLKASELSVKEIAYASGYQTSEHFLRLFKKRLQLTPSEYRQSGNPE